MSKKQIKKNKISTVLKKSVNLPIFLVIIFSLLLAGISFATGIILIKVKLNLDGANTSKLTSNNVFAATKTDKPQLDFYVMSFCPYGNDIEEVIRPVFDLLGDKVELRPRYIFEKVEGSLSDYCIKNNPNVANCATYVKNSNGQLKDINDCKSQIAAMIKECNNESKYLKIGNNFYTALHGRIEANQNVREICAYNLNEDKKAWWDFIKNTNDNCTYTNADTCWEEQAKKAGLDTNKITECFNKDALSLIEAEIADTTKNKITGSPTLMIDGKIFPPEIAADSTDKNIKIGKEVFSLSDIRTPNVIKAALCSGFDKTPKECKNVLEMPKTEDGQVQGAAEGGC